LRTIKITILTVLFAILSFSPPIVVSHSQSLDEYKLTPYVNNLIDSYNALVNSNYKEYPVFNDYKQCFSLYHEVGNSFSVIVLRGESPDYINLLFSLIPSESPQIIIKNNTLSELMHSNVTSRGYIKKLTVKYADTIIYASPVLAINLQDISGDYMVNSKNMAEYIYKIDERDFPKFTQVLTTQSTQTSQNGKANGDSTTMIGIVIGAITVCGTAILLYFGSLRDVIRVIGFKKEREKALKEIKVLMMKFKKIIKKSKQKPEEQPSDSP